MSREKHDKHAPLDGSDRDALSPFAAQRRRWVRAAALSAAGPWAGGVLAAEPETPPDGEAPTAAEEPDDKDPMAVWLDMPAMARADLSPDGQHLAAVGYGGGIALAYVVDLTTGKVLPLTPTTRVAGRWMLNGYYPEDVRWIGQALLVLRMSNGQSFVLTPAGAMVRALDGFFVMRLDDADDGAERLLVARGDELHVVNLRTGARLKNDIDLPDVIIGVAFDSKGRLRAATTKDASRWTGEQRFTQWYRSDQPGAKWRKLEESTDFEAVWQPLQVLDDGTIAVQTRGDRDALGVFRYDPAQGRLGELMAGHATDDILATVGLTEERVGKVVTNGLKRQTYWFDAGWARLQKSVDAALPGTLNALSGNKDGMVLVHSRSDVEAGRWYRLDTATRQIAEVGVARPRVDTARMRPMEAYRYPARDGLSVPAYLTRPAGDGPAPTVVLIHGGPWVRDAWQWDPEVQMLAAAGYAVFQPQFRGSTGFGHAFAQAGYRQWGLSMQDDITDGVQQLIDRGIADPSRLAIVGASYGGYAAMWGLVKTPKLYRCGVSFAGVSDLTDFLTISWNDDANAETRRLRRRLVGDPATARQQLDAVSPIHHVGRIEAPLLLVHGELDRRVLPGQSENMLKAMRRSGKAVEWLPLPRAGHGLFWPSDKRRYYGELLAFLGRHLGPVGAAPA
ncbi:S9 family peptidase [Mitsuaria sp. GD03876]|uniref:alpha/beta hydrolase family protein n=1 Tax=Mitsuaria sp. GD03876 TaxID=2975399 RepID=UPI00244CD26F|nr:S9 family peptidase [Mitsuaria sp. GD03876]MDH0865460.1 S9 family peptidase [Mitsuaria sp. GD03876]